MSNLTLLHPYALLLIPFYLICKRFCKQAKDGILFTRTDILQTLFKQKNRLIGSVEFLTVVFLTLSLSYPTIIHQNRFESKERTACMLLLGYPYTKEPVEYFLDTKPCDTIGAVFFGKSTFTVAAPTKNMALLKRAVFAYKDAVQKPQSLENAFAQARAYLDRNATLYTDIHLSAEQQERLRQLFSLHIRYITDIAPDTRAFTKTRIYKEPLFTYPLFVTVILLAFYLYLINRIKR